MIVLKMYSCRSERLATGSNSGDGATGELLQPLREGGVAAIEKDVDRHILLDDKRLQRKVWQSTANPGVILQHGEIIGIWTAKKKGQGMEVDMTLERCAFCKARII